MEKCTLNIYEIVPVLEYKEKWGMKFVDLEKSDKTEEKLIKSYTLNLLNAQVGAKFNYKERSIEPDHWCQDFTFDVEISDELKEFLERAKDANPNVANDTILALQDGRHIPSRLEKELCHFANDWLWSGGKHKDFRYAISLGSDGREEYKLEKTPHYVVKLDIRK